MSERVSVSVRVLLYPGEPGDQPWVAQGIEYDVFGSGATEDEALKAFELAFADEVAWALEQGRTPLENVPSAPTRFRDLLSRTYRYSGIYQTRSIESRSWAAYQKSMWCIG